MVQPPGYLRCLSCVEATTWIALRSSCLCLASKGSAPCMTAASTRSTSSPLRTWSARAVQNTCPTTFAKALGSMRPTKKPPQQPSSTRCAPKILGRILCFHLSFRGEITADLKFIVSQPVSERKKSAATFTSGTVATTTV